ncbi:hypothetical protein DPX16_7232 [Anabarilius grahami]|uniref:Uncharacterized protein n=1 Tax=Anabarilius grahami TaxID=495550 RepID=A0A3N0XMU8_ANAGA|nr:hypothetical protein DPX16_7232 [Anabarilius grahami]
MLVSSGVQEGRRMDSRTATDASRRTRGSEWRSMRKRRRQVRIPGRYSPQLSWLKEDEPLCRSHRPSRLGPKREKRVRPPDPAPYLDPSYPPTALPSRFPGTTMTPGLTPHPLCPSFAPPATLVENAGKAELRQRSWVPADDVIPSRSRKFEESRTGTGKQRRQPPNHYQGDRSLSRACMLVSSGVQEGRRMDSRTATDASRRTRGSEWRSMRKGRRQVRIPGRYSPQLSWLKEDEPLCRSRRPSCLGPKREKRVRPPDPAPYLDPSYPPTALPSRFPGTTMTPGITDPQMSLQVKHDSVYMQVFLWRALAPQITDSHLTWIELPYFK